jgi:hypothetical protein
MASESKTTFCVNSVLAKVLREYIDPTEFDQLKAEIGQHTYARLKWKLLQNPACQNEDPRFSCLYRTLFLNERSVIVQEVELGGDRTRFGTYKIMLPEWSRVFINWGEERRATWDWCWNEGMNMYRDDSM